MLPVFAKPTFCVLRCQSGWKQQSQSNLVLNFFWKGSRRDRQAQDWPSVAVLQLRHEGQASGRKPVCQIARDGLRQR